MALLNFARRACHTAPRSEVARLSAQVQQLTMEKVALEKKLTPPFGTVKFLTRSEETGKVHIQIGVVAVLAFYGACDLTYWSFNQVRKSIA